MAFQPFKAAGKEETPSFTQAAYAEAKMANEREMAKQAYKAQLLQAGGIGAMTYNRAMGDKTPIGDYVGEQWDTYVTGDQAAADQVGIDSGAQVDMPPAQVMPDETMGGNTYLEPEMGVPPAEGLPADAITPDIMQETGASMVDPLAEATLRQSLEQAAGEQVTDAALQEAGTQVAAEGGAQLAGAQAASSWNPYLSAALLAYRMYG